jgi:AraC-like DNA-binding protein
MNGYPTYHFHKTKYGCELLIDLIRLESLERYIRRDPVHCLTYFDITYILDGKGTFRIDNFGFPICRNQLFFTAPNQIRKWEIQQMPQGLVLIFEEEFLCNFFNDTQFVQKLSFFTPALHPPILRLNKEQGRYFENILVNIENEIFKEKDYHLLRALLYQALAWLNNSYRSSYHLPENTGIHKQVLRFGQLVEQYFKEYHSVNFYAGKLCVTPGHLTELVKNQYAVTAKQYLQNRLMLEAKRLLLYTELQVSEIAWELNFQDPSYFIRLFHSGTGVSPLTFRKKYNP